MASTIPVCCRGIICFISRLWRFPDLEKFRSQYSFPGIESAAKCFESRVGKHFESESLHLLDIGYRTHPFGRLAQNTHLWIGIHGSLLRDNDSQPGGDHSYLWDGPTVRAKDKSDSVGSFR